MLDDNTKLSRLTATSVAAAAITLAIVAPATATPPGINGKIAWQREARTGFPHIWVANPDGSDARQPLAAAADHGEVDAAFSPTDANAMFFTRVSETPFSEDLYKADLATGGVTRVTRAPTADLAPTVSPDGTKLVYYGVPRPRRPDSDTPPPPQRIHVAGIDGSADRAITSPGRRSFDPDWSPDGRRIVYCESRVVRRNLAQNRIVVINADGTARRALTAYGGRDEINPKWMPDGQTIVFEQFQQRGTRSDIAAINAGGGAQRTILATPAWETNPVPSPDGTRIVFTSDRDRRGRDRLGPGFEVYTMAPNGSAIARITNNNRPDMFPDWQRLQP